MVFKSRIKVLGIVFTQILSLFFSMTLQAQVSLLPPENNPHPPQTQEEKKRVAFAKEALGYTLGKNWSQVKEITPNQEDSFLDKDLACLKNLTCFEKDKNFLFELLQIQKLHGKVEEIKHAHLVPAQPQFLKQPSVSYPAPQELQAPLKPGEFVVHVYAKMKKQNEIEKWFNLDLIMTQNKEGNLFLRHFFIVPIELRAPC